MRSGDGSRPDEDLALQFYDVDPADRPPPECIVRIRGVVGLCDLLEDRLNSLGDGLDLKARFADLEIIRQTEPDRSDPDGAGLACPAGAAGAGTWASTSRSKSRWGWDLIEEGARVLAIDINLAAAGETRASSTAEGGDCTVVETDVSRSDQVGAMIEAWLETYGRIDILHNNVGILEVGGPVIAEPIKEAYGSGDLERMIEVRDSQCPMKGMTYKVVCRA